MIAQKNFSIILNGMKKITFFNIFLTGSLFVAVHGSLAQDITVIDGDSLQIGERRIRLDGIDAPEFLQSCQTAQGFDYPCGQAALAYAQELIANQELACRCLQHKDRYKREICECFIGQISLNEAMVQAGWATAYRDGQYLSAENSARRQKRGIWQGKNMRPAIYRALERYQRHRSNPQAEHHRP